MEGITEPSPLLESHRPPAAEQIAQLALQAVAAQDAEPDTYPWTDAAQWRADGGPDELAAAPEASAACETALDELFARLPQEQLGSPDDMGWSGLLRHPDRPGGVVVGQNQYGRWWAWTTESDDELTARWQQAQQEHAAYERAAGGDGNAPRIWVASLSDYNAGVLHGAWLDATVEPDELADAIRFILKNSHEPYAEEHGIFDYDGFSEGVGSLLGEWASLATVSRIANGIVDHGDAYAAWAAYVGPERTEQLDRFEDHYLGEWESIEAYGDELLQESDAYRIVNEAPEWLQPYLTVDVEGYAREPRIRPPRGGAVRWWGMDLRPQRLKHPRATHQPAM